MKILYYSSHPHLSYSAATGYGIHMREIVHGFKNRGSHVELFINGGSSSASIESDEKNIPDKNRFKKFKKFVPKYIWESLKGYDRIRLDKRKQTELLNKLDETKPDLIYERLSYLMQSGFKVAQIKNIKYVCEINGPIVEEKRVMSGKGFFDSKAEKQVSNILKGAHKIVTVSSAMKEYIIKKYSIKEENIIMTPNAVNPHLLEEISPINVKEIKSKYGINDNDLVFGFIGSIFPYHGVDKLIHAFNQLAEIDNLKLLIVGDGEQLSELKSMSESLSSSGRIFFSGKVSHDEIKNYLSVMNVCVMPTSNWYGSPIKLFEYGLAGKPIIAPNTKPVHDVMIDKIEGILVDNDVKSIHSAMNEMIQNPEKRINRAFAFQKRVLSEHTWQNRADFILDSI